MKGQACLLRRRGEELLPEPFPGEPIPARTPLPASLILGHGGEEGPPGIRLANPAALAVLRPLVGPAATGAVLHPVPPPHPAGTPDLFLLFWFETAGAEAAGGIAERAAPRLARLAAEYGESSRAGEGAAETGPELLESAFELSSEGLLLLDTDGRALRLNRTAARLAGPEVDLVPGASLLEKLPPAAAARLRELMDSATAGALATDEMDLAPPGERARPFHVAVDLLPREGGRAWLASFRSLTERDRLVEMLRREKDFTRSLLEAANACVLGLDPQGRTILFNRVFQESSGWRLADVLGLEAIEILAAEDQRPFWREVHLHALSGEPVEDRDLRIRTRSGGERTLCLSAGRIHDAAGACRGVLLTGRDVTEERRRERSLRTREEATSAALGQLKDFSRISSLILQEKELDSVCRMFVEAISKLSTFRRAILTLCDENFCGYQWYFAGLSAGEIETFHRNKMTNKDRITIFQERFRLGNSYYIPHSEKWHYTGVRSQENAEEMLDWHPDDFLFIPLYGTNRRIVGIVSVDDPQDGRRPTAESISPLELFANQVAHSIEEKKLDQEVRRTTERYRILVETMYDGVLTVDLRERILFANAAFTHLAGVAEPLITGRPLGSFLEPDDLALFRAETGLHEGGRIARFEMKLRSAAGEAIPVHVSASPFRENGELKGCFALVRDLREQKKSETDRKAMQEQLMQAEKLSALGELISGIAHELNNPLTGVMGYSQLLLGSASPGMKKDLERIHREAVRCQKIVQNLLTFARRRSPEREMVDVNRLVEATLDLRAYQLRVDGVEVVLDLDPGAPRTLGDFHQLQQVFLNVVNNAHHAILETGRPGRLEIRTRQAGGRIRVSFRDSGPGIPSEHMKKIFDPFFTTKETGKGTGLGLSLSYGIVKEHEGRIEVESRPGAGACFTVDLPHRTEMPSAPAGGEAKEEDVAVEAKHILVVDDEETILDLLESVLEASGHSVETASNGRQALEKIRAADYDIIISDVKMPDMGGQMLYEGVSEIKPHLRKRIIFSTGDTVNPATQELFQRTGNAYLSKPFRLEEVDAIIHRILRECEGGEIKPRG